MARAHVYEADHELRSANYLAALDGLADLLMLVGSDDVASDKMAGLVRLLSMEARHLLLLDERPTGGPLRAVD